MNIPLILGAEEGANQQEIFNEILSHLSPHRYGWAPIWKIGSIDLSITNAVVNIWLSALLVIAMFWIASRRSHLVPRGIRNVVEAAMDWVKDNIVYAVMSPEDGRVWGPLVTTIFFFILFMNAIGLIPIIGFTPTANIFLTASLALWVYLLAVTVGVVRHGFFRFWKKTLYPSGVPIVVALLMAILIEPLSQLARPLSLAVRLFANMLTDHLLLLVFAGFIFIAGGILVVVILPLSLAFMVLFTGFALFIAAIQAFVFAFLASTYINDALHPGH